SAGYRVMGAGKIFHAQGNQRYLPEYAGGFGGFGPLPDEKLAAFDGVRLWDWGVYPEHESMMPDHQVVSWAIERLEEPATRPFFLAVGLVSPHVPLYVPADVDRALGMGAVRLPEVAPDDLDDLSAYARDLTTLGHIAPTQEWVRTNDQWETLVRLYLECVTFTDAQVGRLLDALDSSPHASNTIVVLFSDHGFHLGEKGRWAKRSLWHESTRVPLVIAGPGIAPAPPCDQPVGLIDLYPTLLDLVGVDAPPRLEGHSLVPLLDDPQSPWPHMARTTFGPGNVSITSARYHFIRYRDGSEELYDRARDPHEWTNLATSAAHAPILDAHRTHLPAHAAGVLGRGSTGHRAFEAAEGRRAERGRARPVADDLHARDDVRSGPAPLSW
ncbi:MAG: sulfatase-like hydrolase/transferase, partial [Phycisphaerales bacterium]|nr:sulfatase-like hydrolase/transferase [Phycisphaerales bacterium]